MQTISGRLGDFLTCFFFVQFVKWNIIDKIIHRISIDLVISNQLIDLCREIWITIINRHFSLTKPLRHLVHKVKQQQHKKFENLLRSYCVSSVCVCVITEIKSAFSLLGPNHEESHFPIKSTRGNCMNFTFWNNGQEQWSAIKNSVSQKFSLKIRVQ